MCATTQRQQFLYNVDYHRKYYLKHMYAYLSKNRSVKYVVNCAPKKLNMKLA